MCVYIVSDFPPYSATASFTATFTATV